MPAFRRFLVAPSLARLVRKERDAANVIEGYFADQPHRTPMVQLEGDHGRLVLLTHAPEGWAEEWVEIPRVQAEALLAVTVGQVGYTRTTLPVGKHEVQLEHFIRPGRLDLISVEFDDEETAQRFIPPAWFGPEISADPAYQHWGLARDGLPALSEVELTAEALHSVLDLLENRVTPWPDEAEAQMETGALVSASASELVSASEVDPDEGDLGTEDAVVRELAYSLRPQLRR
jgi:CYTH domain-containing protein